MNDDGKPIQFTSNLKQWRKLRPIARDMRHAPTPAGSALWQQLRKRSLMGVKFRRQHTIDGFIVDFVSLDDLLIIEVDGDIHDEPDQRDYDAQRQAYLEAKGFRLLRFQNGEVIHSIDAVLKAISDALQEPPK